MLKNFEKFRKIKPAWKAKFLEESTIAALSWPAPSLQHRKDHSVCILSSLLYLYRNLKASMFLMLLYL